MATFFKDYEELVLQAYERKKVDNELPHGLKYLTPAKLKEECVVRCKKGVNRLDEMIIREFCGDLDGSKSCLTIIQRHDTDKFKPLVNYLRGKSESTDPKNIELLAWLIEFSDRPWDIGKSFSDGLNEDPPLSDTGPVAGEPETVVNTPANESDIQTGIPENPENPMRLLGEDVDTKTEKAGKQVKKGRSRKRLVATVVLSLVLATGGAWLLIHIYTRPGSCMYWSEDHYKPIACDQKIPNVRIIALDMTKLKNFRKITTPDTITYLAIGKVWYSKINNKVEFYTWYGEHPVSYGRWLKPVSKYIIDTYIHSGTITNSN